jgi:hypothetical protein
MTNAAVIEQPPITRATAPSPKPNLEVLPRE